MVLQEKPWEVVDLSQKLEVMEEREVRAWTSVWAVEEDIQRTDFLLPSG